MKKNVVILIVIGIMVSLLLSACNRPAATPPVSPTAAEDFPFPVEGDLNALMTQTAVAEPKVIEEATPTPVTPGESAVSEEEEEQPEEEVEAAVVPTLTRPTTYTLKKGEFPFCIARRYDLNVSSLLALNGLTIDSKPPVGFVLKIPSTGTWDSGNRALKSHPATYTVKAGDTIYTIACQYGDVSPEAIIAVNGLSEPYTLEAGQELRIP